MMSVISGHDAVTLTKLGDLETTRERCARVCYAGSWPCLSRVAFAKKFVKRN